HVVPSAEGLRLRRHRAAHRRLRRLPCRNRSGGRPRRRRRGVRRAWRAGPRRRSRTRRHRQQVTPRGGTVTTAVLTAYILMWPLLVAIVLFVISRGFFREGAEARRDGEDLVWGRPPSDRRPVPGSCPPRRDAAAGVRTAGSPPGPR